MKVAIAALLAASLVLPMSSASAAEKLQGQTLQKSQAQQAEKPNMTRQYRAKRHYRPINKVRYYRTPRCDPFMRSVFGICTM